MQNTEETIAKYAVDANLSRLGSTNPSKMIAAFFEMPCVVVNYSCQKLLLIRSNPSKRALQSGGTRSVFINSQDHFHAIICQLNHNWLLECLHRFGNLNLQVVTEMFTEIDLFS